MGPRLTRKCMPGCKRYSPGVHVHFFIKIGKVRSYFLSFLQILMKFHMFAKFSVINQVMRCVFCLHENLGKQGWKET